MAHTKVLGVCNKHPNLKRYILWALKLCEDMPRVFTTVEFSTEVKPGFDVYISDHAYADLPNALICLLQNTHNPKDQSLSELEIMAQSGFLSVVGLANIPTGTVKDSLMLPQQPTDHLMFYYVHSLMAVTRVLLHLGQPQTLKNVASENLIYLCKGVFSMRQIGLWNNEQG